MALAGLGLVACGGGEAPVDAGGPGARSGSTVPGTDPGAPVARSVRPEPDTVGLRARPYESAHPVGERGLAVRYWSGVAPCEVLGRVDVAETDTTVVVTLYTGRDGSAPPDVVCIEIALLVEARVELAQPLGSRTLVDGAAER